MAIDKISLTLPSLNDTPDIETINVALKNIEDTINTIIDKYNPQYMFARNKNAKVNLTAYDPLPLEVSSVVGDELTLSSDGKYVVVGNDISYVRVTASLQFVSSTASSQSMMIRRDRNGTVVVVATSVGYGTNISLDKTVCMSVVKGDKIQVISNKDSVINSADTGGLRSGLIVEKIC